jgi:hypothetical protein
MRDEIRRENNDLRERLIDVQARSIDGIGEDENGKKTPDLILYCVELTVLTGFYCCLYFPFSLFLFSCLPFHQYKIKIKLRIVGSRLNIGHRIFCLAF